MRLAGIAVVSLAVASLIGCATTPSPFKSAPPESAQSLQHGLAKSDIVARTDHTTQHLNAEQTVVYFQNQGGGGAGLGLLLGPFGVAANMKMIEGITNQDVDKLRGKFPVDPELAFKQAAAAAKFPIQDSAKPGDVKVTPYVLVSKTDTSKVHISSTILFEGMDGANKWRTRYQYQLPGKYTVDELAALDAAGVSALQAGSASAFESLLKQMQHDTAAEIAKEKKITFTSPYMSPRFVFEMRGSLVGEQEGRIWVRTILGVTAVDPSEIEYQVGAD
jgi:hypothetical protein